MMDPHATFEELAGKRQYYQDKLVSNGHPGNSRDIPMARTLAMADTLSEATEVGRRGAEFMFGSYLRKRTSTARRRAARKPCRSMPSTRQFGTAAIRLPSTSTKSQFAVTRQVIDHLQELEETVPLEYLMVAPLSQLLRYLYRKGDASSSSRKGHAA